MSQFIVQYEEHTLFMYPVEAENGKEAIEKFKELVCNDQVDFSSTKVCDHVITTRTADQIKDGIWKVISDIPVDDNGCITVAFLEWPIGSPKDSIFQWFDSWYPDGHMSLEDKTEET